MTFIITLRDEGKVLNGGTAATFDAALGCARALTDHHGRGTCLIESTDGDTWKYTPERIEEQ